jgi:hypothetical protein
MGSLLVCNWPHYVGQNHFYVMMLFNRDSAIQSALKRFCLVYKSENSVPCQPSGRPTIQSIIRLDDVDFRPDLPLCREASNCSSLHLSGRLVARPDDPQCSTKASGFLSKT